MDFQLNAELLGEVIYITALERLQQIFFRPSGNSRRHPHDVLPPRLAYYWPRSSLQLQSVLRESCRLSTSFT